MNAHYHSKSEREVEGPLNIHTLASISFNFDLRARSDFE